MSTTIVSSAFDTSGNGGRKIVRLSNGWIVAGAVEPSFAKGHIFVSKDNGTTWSELCYFTSSSIQGLSIASNGTTVYILATLANVACGIYKFDATTVAVGSSLNSIGVNIDSGQTSVGQCSIAIDSAGKLWAVWCSTNSTYPNRMNIRVSSSVDGGTTWASPTQITTTTGGNPYYNQNPCMVLRSNNYPTILFEQYQGNYYTASAYWNGSSWVTNAGGGITIYNGGSSYAQSNPCGAVDSNDVIYAGWDGADATTSHHRARWSKSTDGGATWSAMALINPSSTNASTNVTFVVRPDNSLDAFWNEIDPAINATYLQIRRANLPAGSSTWSAPVTITNNTTADAKNPQTLWSKFNMNSSNAVRYMWQDMQASSVKYDSITLNSPPNAPTYSYITSNGSTVNGRPKFILNVSDPDSGNTIQNTEIQVASDSGFSSIIWDAQYGTDSGYGTQYTGWSGLPTVSNTSTQISWLPPNSLSVLTAGTRYVRVRCKDNNGAWSAWSATQSFTVSSVPWSDAPNGYGLKAQWMNDLANVVNNARQFRGLSTFGFTDGTVTTSTDMKATHVTERRSKLNDVLSIVGVTPTWTDPTVDTTTDRSGQHVVDLRTYSSQT